MKIKSSSDEKLNCFKCASHYHQKVDCFKSTDENILCNHPLGGYGVKAHHNSGIAPPWCPLRSYPTKPRRPNKGTK